MSACFTGIDGDAVQPLVERLGLNEDPELWNDENDILLQERSKNYTPTWGWANTRISPTSNLNVVSFSSGWGDGGYPSYFGYDKHENPVALVTDFGLLEVDL